MVLILDQDNKISNPIKLSELYSTQTELLNQAKKFARIPPRIINPEGVLYIRQKEDVVTFRGDKLSNGDKVVYVGTQDVLTCHVVVLHHAASGVTALAHYDEYVRERRLQRLVNSFCEQVIDRTYWYQEDSEYEETDWEWEDYDGDADPTEGVTDEELQDLFKTIELKLIGGYDEISGKGSVLSQRILSFFATHQLSFALKLCCLGPANTRGSGRTEPIVGGVVVDVRSAKTEPANFKRTFVDSLPEDVIMTLMLGPSLIKKPFKLKEMILAKEDEGFSKSRSTN